VFRAFVFFIPKHFSIIFPFHHYQCSSITSVWIFWTELSCWCNSCSSKATLLLSWSHRYKNYMVVITIWLTVVKHPFLKWHLIFFLFIYIISFLYYRTLYIYIYIWLNRWVSYKKQGLLSFREHLGSPAVFNGGRCCSSFIVSCIMLCFCVLFVLVLCLVSLMLAVSMNCLSPVSCEPNVGSVYGLS
jgi:hypothetical protein